MNEPVVFPNPQPRNKWRKMMKGVTSKKKLARLRTRSAKGGLERRVKYTRNLEKRKPKRTGFGFPIWRT